MSGYFRRLLTQSAMTSAHLRPARIHPYATPPVVDTAIEQISEPRVPGGEPAPADAARRDTRPDGRPQQRLETSAHDAQQERRIAESEPARDVPDVQHEHDSVGEPRPAHRIKKEQPIADRVTTTDVPAHSREGVERRDQLTAPVPDRTLPVLRAPETAASDFHLLSEIARTPELPHVSAAASRPAAPRSVQAGHHADHSTSATGETPSVHITIGRIEVTANHAVPPVRKRREPPAAMSLDEYLTRRRRGGA